MIKILLKHKQKVLKTFETDKDRMTIGRLKSNDIHINEIGRASCRERV